MNKPPVRLLESPDLSSAERTLLDAARSVPPVHYDAVAGAAKLQATLASLPASTGATALATKALTAVKLAAVLIPVLGAATYFAARSHTEAASVDAKPVAVELAPAAEAPPPAMLAAAAAVEPEAIERDRGPSAEVVARSRPAPTRAATADTRAATPTRVAAADTRAATPTRVVRSVPVAASASTAEQPASVQAEPAADVPVIPEALPDAPAEQAPEAATPAPVSDSISELRGIAQARVLLERDPAAALTLLQRLARAHPKGYFIEERLALTVIASARIGDSDSARSQAIRFLRTYPKSPFADRVRAAVQ